MSRVKVGLFPLLSMVDANQFTESLSHNQAISSYRSKGIMLCSSCLINH